MTVTLHACVSPLGADTLTWQIPTFRLRFLSCKTFCVLCAPRVSSASPGVLLGVLFAEAPARQFGFCVCLSERLVGRKECAFLCPFLNLVTCFGLGVGICRRFRCSNSWHLCTCSLSAQPPDSFSVAHPQLLFALACADA